jgi:uridine kinase
LTAITKLALDLADQIPTPIILIDGRAGSGKSSFAEELRNELFRKSDAAPVLIHMDELYPGWEGLRAGSQYLQHNILQPLRAGKVARWQTWDWASGKRGNESEPGNGWREFQGGNLLIVEGCGAISRQSLEIANLGVWMEAEGATRKTRIQSRDQGVFDQFWGVWQAQEDEFYETERPEFLPDWVISN